MSSESNIAHIRRLLIGHGALLILLAGIIGFGFLFFLIGKIALWPIPGEINYQLPGTYDAWRMAHMEAITNGLLLWLTAAILPHMPFSTKGLIKIGYAIIVIGWTIVLASSLDPLFPDSRGLEFPGNLSNNIAFFLFYIGVFGVMAVMALVAYRSLFGRHDDTDLKR